MIWLAHHQSLQTTEEKVIVGLILGGMLLIFLAFMAWIVWEDWRYSKRKEKP